MSVTACISANIIRIVNGKHGCLSNRLYSILKRSFSSDEEHIRQIFITYFENTIRNEFMITESNTCFLCGSPLTYDMKFKYCDKCNVLYDKHLATDVTTADLLAMNNNPAYWLFQINRNSETYLRDVDRWMNVIYEISTNGIEVADLLNFEQRLASVLNTGVIRRLEWLCNTKTSIITLYDVSQVATKYIMSKLH